jgi:subtilase family serine protease
VQKYCVNDACTKTYTVNIQHESVWGWDYLEGLCKALGYSSSVACGIFPAGSGGGVSVVFDEPLYQIFVPNIQLSQPNQVFRAGKDYSEDGGLYYALPSHFPGRNVPDISFNADPQTGYVIYYTSDVSGFGYLQAGGTSFVAPQLNGVSALMGEYLHSRIGLLNFPLYGLALSDLGYRGPAPALHPIAYGDNWFYHGSNGYNRGAGLGILDVANFAETLHNLF